MGFPQRLPKTKEERDFDKLMRGRRPSVWEDKGSVGDARFRSLKGAAKLHQEHPSAGSLLPPLAGSISGKESGGADGAHDAGAMGAAPDAAQRAPRRHLCVSLCPAPASVSDRTIAVSGYFKAPKLPVTGSCASFIALVYISVSVTSGSDRWGGVCCCFIAHTRVRACVGWRVEEGCGADLPNG